MTTNWNGLPYEAHGQGQAYLNDVRVWKRLLVPREDRVAFRFQDNQVPDVSIDKVSPPITDAGSGEVIKMKGHSFIHVKFFPAWIANFNVDPYELTYKGPRYITPPRRWVRSLALTDSFEGYVGWVIGLNGDPQINVRQKPGEVLLTFGR
jgi:hypothetical protein